MNLSSAIILLRPHQYVKNLFVFAPLIFGLHFSFLEIIIVFAGFLVFSLLASSVYVLNDIFDREEDRQHPEKKFRPIASGAVSASQAWVLFFILSVLSLLLSYILSTHFFLILLIYFAMNLAYSFGLKHISILDICIISTGFVLRLYAGASIIEIETSMWIVVITFLLALFLALAKRRDDVLHSLKGREVRKSIDGYNLEFVNVSMGIMAGVVIVSYLLYTTSNDVILRVGTDKLYLTVFFVIAGILRYIQLTFVEGKSGNPSRIVLKDHFLQVAIIGWFFSFMVMIS